MKIFLKNINWYILLLALTINLLIMIIFYDVFRARKFYMDTQNWVGIFVTLLIILLLLWKFNQDKFCSENKIITLLISIVFFSLILQKYIMNVDYFNISGELFKNPLYSQFKQIAKNHNSDLSFTKNTWVDDTPIDYQHSGLFLEKPKSIDILFIGDSTIAWGFVPKIVEQETGKKVGIYAIESNFLTTETSKLFTKIANYYLKDDGIVVFCFDNWTKSQKTNSVGKAKEKFNEMLSWSDTKLIYYFENYSKNLQSKIKLTKIDDNENSTVSDKQDKEENNWYTFSSFQEKYNNLSEKLKKMYHLQLKSPHLYFDYLEPILNPNIHKAKKINQNRDTLHLRWDYNTITQYNPNFEDYSIHSNESTFEELHNEDHLKNALAASKITAGKKIYIVPLYTKESSYEESRNLYKNYYKNVGFGICDLGNLYQSNEHYEMQSRAHMGNTGGVMQSFLMSKCFNYTRIK